MLPRLRRGAQRLRTMDLRRIAGLFTPYRGRLLLVAAFAALGAACAVAPPLLLRHILDDAIPDRDTGLLVALVVGMLVAAIAVGVAQYGQTMLIHRVGQQVMHDLRRDVHHHLRRLPLRYFVDRQTGELLSRIANDIGGLQGVFTSSVGALVTNLTTVVGGAVAMIALDARLAALALLSVPAAFLLSRLVGRRRRVLTAQRQVLLAQLAARMEQTLSASGVLLSRTTGQDKRLGAEFDAESQKLADVEVQARTAGQGTLTAVSTLVAALPALAYLAGGLIVTAGDGNISLGTIVAFATVQALVLSPVLSLATLGVALYSSLAHFERVFDVLDEPIEDEGGDGVALPARAGAREVVFDGVRFGYRPGVAVLDDVSFTLEPGSRTALVGSTGAGKSTITALLTRLYTADAGAVLIDGVDVRSLSRRAVSDVVGVVTQDTYLLHASVAENLRFAKPEATEEELREAVRIAQLDRVIDALPDGLDTVVGDRGHRFSGGERQRVAIARVLLRDPAILILDEATSALDVETEAQLQDALEALAADRTTLVISHRPNVTEGADQVLTLREGRIVAQSQAF